MNVQRAYLCVFLGTAVALFLIPVAESTASSFETTAEVLAAISALGTILLIILASIAWSEVALRTVRIAAFWAAALPFTIAWMLSLVGKEPNVHGISMPTFFFCTVVLELSALTFEVIAEVKKRA